MVNANVIYNSDPENDLTQNRKFNTTVFINRKEDFISQSMLNSINEIALHNLVSHLDIPEEEHPSININDININNIIPLGKMTPAQWDDLPSGSMAKAEMPVITD